MRLVELIAFNCKPLYINPEHVTDIFQEDGYVRLNIIHDKESYKLNGSIEEIASKLTETRMVNHENT